MEFGGNLMGAMRLVGQLSLGCRRDALLVHLIPRAAKMAGRAWV
jgi:hypothetical protein